MSLIRFDTESFVKSLEPGICAFIVQEFQNRLESKLNGIVDEIYAELEKEMPNKVKTTILQMFDLYDDKLRVHVEVDLKSSQHVGDK